MSFLIPSSSDTTSSTCPTASSLIFFDVMMIGIGQKYPSVSSFTSACIVSYSSVPWLNKQIHIALLGCCEIGGHAGELVDTVDQGVFRNPHHAHRRRAGDEAHTEVHGGLHEFRYPRHPVLLHNLLHHLGTEAAEMESGKRQVVGTSPVQDTEHAAEPILG